MSSVSYSAFFWIEGGGMASAVVNMTTAALDWIAVAFDAPLAGAVVFGVRIDGIFVLCTLLNWNLLWYFNCATFFVTGQIYLVLAFSWLKGILLSKGYLLLSYCSNSLERAISLRRSHLLKRFVYWLKFLFFKPMLIFYFASSPLTVLTVTWK